jgi:hypothetical protein
VNERARRALEALDRVVARWPRLRSPAAQARLADALDASEEGGDSGSDGQGHEGKGRGTGDAGTPPRR